MSDDRKRLLEALPDARYRPGVRAMPPKVASFFLEELAALRSQLDNNSQHRQFLRHQGGFDSDWYDAGFERDGVLEQMGALEAAIAAFARDGLGGYQAEFDEWLKKK